MAAPRVLLVLGAMPADARPATHWAAGAWCFAGCEERFPHWERDFSFAPEPFASVADMTRASGEAKALCAAMLPRLAARLHPQGGLPEAYWETLLVPWAANVAKQAVERWWRVKRLTEAWGAHALHVPLLPVECDFPFANGHEYVLRGALGHAWNHWLFSRLLEAAFPPAWTREYLPPARLEPLPPSPAPLKERLRGLARRLMLALPCPKLKGMRAGQALRYSLALLHKSHGPDRATPLSAWGTAATGLAPDLPLDPFPLFLASLPRDLATLRHPDSLTPDPLGPRLRVASVLAYEDAAYRRRLALWRGRGNRLMYAQHGSDYGQSAVLTEPELTEYSQHAFATWGWTRHGNHKGNFIPLPYPQLEAERRAWHGRQGRDLLLVGTEMPAFPYRLDSHPSPLQMTEYREDKARFANALPDAPRAALLYRPYFPVPGTLRDAGWLAERVSGLRVATGALARHLFGCRLLALDHNGTTLLEAMAANMPMVLFWRRQAWPLTPEAEALLDLLADAGIWHPSPEAAARQAAAVWEDPFAWWMGAAVQRVRRTYMAAQVLLPPGGPDAAWLKTLKRL